MMEAATGREHLHGMWASVAGSWGEHATYVDARGAALTEKMLELASPKPGDRVLELACGPGGLGLAAAPRVAPGGEVVLSDVVAEMTSIAAARADAVGLRNVRTRVLDLEQIDEPDGSYDVVALPRRTDVRGRTRARSARSGACCDRAEGLRSRSGGRASATPGSGSFSTR